MSVGVNVSHLMDVHMAMHTILIAIDPEQFCSFHYQSKPCLA